MKHSAFKSKIRQEYAFLNDMIRQTSGVLVSLVQTQGSAIRLQYTRKEMFLCLVRKNDDKGRCCGVRWAKYQYSFKNGRRSWYNFKLPGKVPASTIRLMSPGDEARFRALDAIAARILDLRHDLTSKKMRILTTFRHIRGTDEPRLQKILCDFSSMQDDADLGFKVQDLEPADSTQEAETADEGQGRESTEKAEEPEPEGAFAETEPEEDLLDEESEDAEDNSQEIEPAINLEDLDLSDWDPFSEE